MSIHPARTMDFGDLLDGMEAARSAGLVSRRDDPSTGRSLYCYTQRCVYERGWNDFSLIGRGLILCEKDRRVVATPFPKFFNVGERGEGIPNLPFEVFEKVDGSLAIIHYHEGKWRASTKGAFDSSQAKWTEARLAECDLSALVKGATYLAEAVYPENRIVVRYADAELVLLAAYYEDGTEADADTLTAAAGHIGWRYARRYEYAQFADLIAAAQILPVTAEGFVARFANGLRLKVKGDEYKRIHALISRCTPLAMWEAMAAGDDLTQVRKDLPEEFWTDFDQITAILGNAVTSLEERIVAVAESVAALSDKELGLSLASYPEDVRPFLFPYRKGGNRLEGKSRHALFRAIRPTGNILAGYQPSYSMSRIADEAA